MGQRERHLNYEYHTETAAKRITNAAGDIPVMEFGASRSRGEDSSVEASKYAYVGGYAGYGGYRNAVGE